MESYTHIVANLEQKISEINSGTKNVFEKVELGVILCKNTLNELRLKFLSKTDLSPTEESHFFKNIKPIAAGYLIYYLNLADLEINRPQNSVKKIAKFYQGYLSEYHRYYLHQKDFYHYLERNRTDRDSEYFIRTKGEINFHPDSLPYCMDEDFSTSHDLFAAKIFAHKLLIAHLTKELNALENLPQYSVPTPLQNLRWTGKKVELIELIYALHATATINNGQMDIKELATIFQHLLNIDLGEYYRTYIEIRSRKIKPTRFLDRMTQHLQKRMAQAYK